MSTAPGSAVVLRLVARATWAPTRGARCCLAPEPVPGGENGAQLKLIANTHHRGARSVPLSTGRNCVARDATAMQLAAAPQIIAGCG